MIRRVRKQFVWITMCMLTAVLLVPLVAINVVLDAMSYNQTQNLLEQIAVSETAEWENPSSPDRFPPGQQPRQQTDLPSQVTTGESSVTSAETTTTAVSATAVSTSAANSQGEKQVTAAPAQTASPIQTNAPTQTKPAAVTKNVPRETKPVVTAPPVVTQPPKPQEPDDPPDYEPDDPDYPDEPDDLDEPDDWDEPWRDPWYDIHPGAALLSALEDGLGGRQCMAISSVSAGTREVRTSRPVRDNQKPDGNLPPKGGGNVTIDHFVCFASEEGNLLSMDGTESYTDTEGQNMVNYVLETEAYDGWYGKLQYFRRDCSKGMIIVFSDRSAEILLLHKVLVVSILVFLLMEGVVFLLTRVLTKRAMQPMQETFERQRQFISDAGHELKTPLTIISANVDILQDEIGNNKWLSYIRSQAERMRTLIGDMMNLTKLEMGDPTKDFTTFSLSEAVESAALPFESQAFEQEKQLILEIQENISYTGDLEQIKQLAGIFIDNAIKYSGEHGEIRVTLQQIQNKKTLKIYNTGKGIPEEEKEKIFERFYRSDASRSRTTGGYGLGLSIAQSIAETHRIKIQVESEYEHWICFTLSF